jgi:hypothetical protein
MTYFVYLAKSPLAMLRPQVDPARLLETHCLADQPIEAVSLEEVFVRGQGWQNRSISVGDVIQGKNADYLVMPHGFLVVG